MSDRQISFALTAYNESKRCGPHWQKGPWILKCIEAAVTHPLVGEIIVVDDASPDFKWLQQTLGGIEKVALYRNATNWGTMGNKLRSLALCTRGWAVMADSDNVMGPDFFDCLDEFAWCSAQLYCPAFARPKLDYGGMIGRHNAERFLGLACNANFTCLLNTGNQFVPVKQVLGLFDSHRGPRSDRGCPDYFGASNRDDLEWRYTHDAAECAYMNVRWLMAGKEITVVDGLEYLHRCDLEASAYMDAPALKRALGPIYIQELADYVAGQQHRYQYIGEVRLSGVLCFRYRREDGRIIEINPARLHQRRLVG